MGLARAGEKSGQLGLRFAAKVFGEFVEAAHQTPGQGGEDRRLEGLRGMDGKRLARVFGMEADGQRRESLDHPRRRHHGRPVPGGDAFVARTALGQLADQVGARQFGLEEFFARGLQLQRNAAAGHLVAELAEQVAEDAARAMGLAAFAGFAASFEARRLLLELAEDRQVMEVGGGVGHRCFPSIHPI